MTALRYPIILTLSVVLDCSVVPGLLARFTWFCDYMTLLGVVSWPYMEWFFEFCHFIHNYNLQFRLIFDVSFIIIIIILSLFIYLTFTVEMIDMIIVWCLPYMWTRYIYQFIYHRWSNIFPENIGDLLRGSSDLNSSL